MTAPRCVICGEPVPPRRHAYCSLDCTKASVTKHLTRGLTPEIRATAALPRLCACGAPAREPAGVRGPRPTDCAACYGRHRAACKVASRAARRAAGSPQP